MNLDSFYAYTNFEGVLTIKGKVQVGKAMVEIPAAPIPEELISAIKNFILAEARKYLDLPEGM